MTSSWLSRGLVVVMVMGVGAGVEARGTNWNQTEAEEFLAMYQRQARVELSATTERYWTYQTNITKENQQAAVDAQLQTDLWKQNMSHLAAQFNTTDFPPSMKRQLAFIQDIGTAALNDTRKLEQLNKVLANLESNHSVAKVCLDDNNCLPLEPNITRAFETSRDEKLLRRLWAGWRDESGKKMKQLYTQFVSLSNEAVRTLGYADTGDYWKSKYESDTFEQDIGALFEELKPFYKQLHAYVRRRLKKQYGEDVFPSSGHIPAHLLGNMWAQQWHSLQDMLMPYPDKPKVDVTAEMVEQSYTAWTIFEVADSFFTSLGLEPMPEAFWNKSMLEKPKDGRDVVCHASAWDFYNGIDFRVKQCTETTLEHFSTAHHEMGHIEYYLLYKPQPITFRNGANPGFHEAIGDTISLSVETPKHLHQIGLLPTLVEDTEADLNFLMAMALQKIAFLPFGYLIDQWRWSVFRGDTTPDSYNKDWWDLRCNLQGVSPPVKRTEDDFDPGAKYHIPSNTPYIRYFVSFVIQFQFHKALCEAAGHQGPLHTCDIYNSTEAGDKLRAMMSKGSSQVWTEPFRVVTGRTKMSAQPLVQYFQPLMTYLEEVNGEDVGWETGCPDPATGTAATQLSSCALLMLATLMTVFCSF
ncbi:angiotensin-converting enzyme-like [Babylonia areolata]|uniref:angiotensin-converting enzyme-like n=1 Tax=Babylonia areolata TaxID=304850 RepID=UPI003FD1A096